MFSKRTKRVSDEKELIDLLREHHLSLSSVESLTGGLFASTITSVPGASDVFKGASVTYSNEMKIKLGVPKQTIDEYSAVSKECAVKMAECGHEYYKSDVCVSFTGNAGPTASEGKPVGECYVAIYVDGDVFPYKLECEGERNEIRETLVSFALRETIFRIKMVF